MDVTQEPRLAVLDHELHRLECRGPRGERLGRLLRPDYARRVTRQRRRPRILEGDLLLTPPRDSR